MLPSRGMARSLPSAGARAQIQSRWLNPPSPSSQSLHARRRFGTLLAAGELRRSRGLAALPMRPALPLQPALPLLLGGFSSSRAFSIWGYGWGGGGSSKTPPDDAAPEPVPPVDPTPQAAVPSAPPTEPAVTASDLDLASIADAIHGQDILNMPQQLGYLHAIGLDFGWGPTSVMQWALEHMHVWAGLGWGGSIIATAIVLRAIMFYPQVRAMRFSAAMQVMKSDPRSQEAMALLQKGFRDGDADMRSRGQYMTKMLREQYGISNWGIAWAFAQIPFTFGLFRIVNNMADIPVPSMETAGYLWFPDLASTDPYFLLPAIGTGLMLGAVAINAKYTPPLQRKMLKPIMYLFGAVGFVGTSFLSAAVNLIAVAVGGSTLVTAIILNNPAVRRAVGLPLAPVTAASKATYEAPRPAPVGIRQRLASNIDDMKKGLSEQMTAYTGKYTGSEQDQAERKRRDMMRKLDNIRREQERQQFDKKYKSNP